MNDDPHHVLITGATSAVGGYLIPVLHAQGCRITAISRGAAKAVPGVQWLQGDLQTLASAGLPSPCALVHLAPIFTLPSALPGWLASGRLKRVVALSSTSVLTKHNARSRRDRELAMRLAEAEASVAQLCLGAGVPYTILRPTLIYGDGYGGGLAFIRDFVWRFGFFPIAGEGKGLRQPVHAEDVALACTQVLTNKSTHNRTYQIAGGEVLSYCEMVRRIALAKRLGPRLVHVPVPLVRLAVAVLRMLPGYRHLTPAVADRMNYDMIFDCSDARRDFGYRPRGFLGILES